jgi:uncharacterized protein (TIGR00251 family)
VDVELLALEAGRATSIAVRAQPGASRSAIAGVWNRHLKIAVRAPAQDGRANEELARVLAEALSLRAQDVELVSGERGRAKRFRVPLPPELVHARLSALGASGMPSP